MNPLRYTVVVAPLAEEDGGGYLTRVPDLPGCMSDGDTPEEAVTNVQDAIAAWKGRQRCGPSGAAASDLTTSDHPQSASRLRAAFLLAR